MGVLYTLSMVEGLGFTRLQRHSHDLTENLLARGERELIYQFYLLRLRSVVLDFRLNEDRVTDGTVL